MRGKCAREARVKMNVEEALLDSSEVLSQRFLLLIQAVSGIRELTSLETDDLSEEELLDRLLDILLENLDLDRCSIFLLDKDRLNCVAGKDWDEHLHPARKKTARRKHTFLLGEGIMGRAAQGGRIYHCKNCRQDKNYLPVIHSDYGNSSGSLICAPIVIGREILGVLNISHPQPNFFHAWQEHVIAIHANILAQMLHNHRLMYKMKDEVKRRTSQLTEALQETEALKNEFQELSLVDELTQLHNRRYFFAETPKILSYCMRYSEPFSLLLLDLDDFKKINDVHGHESGDQVLRDIARAIAEEIRSGDIAARLGGEEFVIALPHATVTGASNFADRIRLKVAEMTWFLDRSDIRITLSIGIAERGNRSMDTEQCFHKLLNESDQALYTSKRTGKNRVSVFTNTQQQ